MTRPVTTRAIKKNLRDLQRMNEHIARQLEQAEKEDTDVVA